MRNEVHRQRSRQEALHPFLVVENFAVEVARIPAHQNVADIKDDDQAGGPLGVKRGAGQGLYQRWAAERKLPHGETVGLLKIGVSAAFLNASLRLAGIRPSRYFGH